LEPPLPKDKTDQSLAIWLKDRFALETYEMGCFYSRHFPSLRWKRHLYGKSADLETYSTGFLYEVVPVSVLERELQRQSDLAPNFRTQSGGEVGTINNQRRKNIIAELVVLLDPVANGETPKFGIDQPAGIATTELIPKWMEIVEDAGSYRLKITNVEAEHSARFAVKCKFDPAAQCPTFDKFLSDSFAGAEDKEEIIECLYRWLAAAVLGITHKYKRSLYCFGPTDSGKSVLLDVISSLFPADGQTSLTFEMLNDRFSPARLVNSRLNIVREVKKANLKSGGFDSENFKTAVSGEPLEAEIKHGAHFTFSPRVAFVSAANGAIPLTNEGAAVYNRISVIHFRNQVAKEDQDIYLIEKLKAETSGILNKIMEAGVRLLNERALLDPPSSQELKKKWSSQLSSTLAWLNQVANPIHKRVPHGKAKDYSTPTAAIYKNYKNWCVVEGVKAKGKVAFWTELEALGAVRKKTKSGDRANITLRKSPQLF
jgi:P4 family phage/plasmid primase-like protien